MNRNLIIPFPPGQVETDFQGVDKTAVGLYPCINADGDCTKFLTIKLDAKGNPYGNCSKAGGSRGCGRSVKGIPADRPAQTFENYKRVLDAVEGTWALSDKADRDLDQDWCDFIHHSNPAAEESA